MAKRIMEAFRLSEISAVDRPAQAHAKVAIMKRGVDKSMYDVAEFARVICSIGYLLQNAESEAAYEGDESPVPEKLRGWLKSGARVFQSMAAEELDELVGAVDKALAAGKAANLSDMENQMSAAIKKALGLADSATDAEVLAAVVKAASNENKEKDAAIAKLTADMAKVATELDLAKMTGDERKFYDDLKIDADRDGFRKADSAARKSQIEKANELPEHIRKQLAEAEDLKKRLAALEDGNALVVIAKAAVDAGLPEAEGVTVQKAYRGDKAAVDRLLGLVKTANGQRDAAQKLAGVFKELGSSQGGGTGDAVGELKALAAKARDKEPNLTPEQAFAKVYSDPANRELVKRERAENRPVAA